MASGWRERIEHNALWLSLGAILLAVAVVAVGVRVAPETFYDRFVWEDIYGPLVVDAYQCRTIATCPGLDGPEGIVVKDGYTVTSELTYGLILAVLLYGIYVGLFRRYKIVADGWFVLGLLPWILLGPLARVLEDANVFCQFGTDCTPNPFAYVFISPVIYLHIAVYVIAFLLLGVYVRERRHENPWKLTSIIGAILLLGLAAFYYVGNTFSFGALPPLWFIALSALAAGAFFHWRAQEGLASVNLTVFVLGVPFAAGCLWLIGRWIAGGVWSASAWNGDTFPIAGAFILSMALLVAALVFALARVLGRSDIPERLGARVARVPETVEKNVGLAGVVALVAAALMAGVLPAFADLGASVPGRATLIPLLAIAGAALLVAFAAIHVGRECVRRPGVLLVYALGINLALVVAHMIDGLATWVALEDPVGFGIPPYSEKHPFSDFLLRYWDGFLFPFTKLLMVLVVVWMLDRELAKPKTAEGGEPVAPSLDERNMIGLVKMAIFVLGFAPGLRDVLRLVMGV